MKSLTLKNIDFDSVVQNTKSSKSIFFNVRLFYHITLSQLPGHKYSVWYSLGASALARLNELKQNVWVDLRMMTEGNKTLHILLFKKLT